MADYQSIFQPYYLNGWENQPSENTPIMGEALDAYDDTLQSLESFLAYQLPMSVGYSIYPFLFSDGTLRISLLDRYGSVLSEGNIMLTSILDKAITETTSTTQPNSHAGREMVLEIGGAESEQDSTAGNQLFDKNASGVKNGYYLSTSGTEVSSSVSSISDYIDVSKFDTAYLNYAGSNTSAKVIGYYDANKTFITYGEYTSSKVLALGEYSYIRFTYVTADADLLMLNEGTTALPYEQYTGGQPAPNPSYPMEIKNSKVKGVKTHRKNFYYADKVISTVKRISTTEVTCDGNDIVVNKSNGSMQERMGVIFTAQIDGEYTLSCESTNFLSVGLEVSDTLPTSVSQTGEKTVFAKKGQYLVISCTLSTSFVGEAILSNIQVEEGTVATPYEPYTESSYTFSQPIDLYGMGGVQDVITPKEIGRKFGEYNLEDLTWTYDETYNLWTSSTFSRAKASTALMCETIEYQKCTLANGINGTSVNYPYNIWARNGSAEISPSGKAIYELATPTTEALPIADQIGLNSLDTYDGITYVEFIYEGLEPTFKGKYGTSEVGGMTLESLLVARNNDLRLTAVENAVVNNI